MNTQTVKDGHWRGRGQSSVDAVRGANFKGALPLSGQDPSHCLLLSAQRSWGSGGQRHPRASLESSALRRATGSLRPDLTHSLFPGPSVGLAGFKTSQWETVPQSEKPSLSLCSPEPTSTPFSHHIRGSPTGWAGWNNQNANPKSQSASKPFRLEKSGFTQ